MTELDPELTVDEYEQHLDVLARNTLVNMVSEGEDYTDPWLVHEYILMGFYEDYPVSVLEHSSIDPTDDDVRRFIEGQPPQHPLEELVDLAQGVLANDVVRYIENSLVEETNLVDVDQNAVDSVENASLTEHGREFL